MLSTILKIVSFAFSTIFSGLFYSILCLFISPFSRIQIILQCIEKSDEPLGAVRVFKKIIKYEGYRGLWKSCIPPIFCFVVVDTIEPVFMKLIPSIFEDASYSDGESYMVWILINVYRASVKGIIFTIFSYPFEFAEIKLAYDARLSEYSKTQYKGIKDLFKKTLLNDGMLGFYSGIGLDLLAMLGFLLIKWTSLALMHSFGFSIDSAISECVAEYFAYSLVYPSLVVKCRIMVRPENLGKRDIWKSFIDIIESEGVSGLFGGYIFVVIEFCGLLCSTLFGKFS